MKNINIYLIRHAESVANAHHKDQIGQDPNELLTENGKQQARKLGERFKESKIDFIHSSIYRRAAITAEIFRDIIKYGGGPKCNIKYSDGLVEYNPGDWRGQNRSVIYSNFDILKSIAYQHMGFKFPGPSGESFHQVERRAVSYIEDSIIYNKDILELANKEEVNVAVFSHGMTIKAILHYVLGFDQSFMWKIKIDNTSVCHIIYNEKGFYLNSINDIAHLRGA